MARHQMPVKCPREKYSTLPKFGNGVSIAVTRPKEEGRIAIVTNAGRAAVDVDHTGAKRFAGRATVSERVTPSTGAVRVRSNRVVLTPGVCASSVAVMWQPNRVRSISHPQGDGGNSASLPGESTIYAVKPLRREGRDVLAPPVCRCADSLKAISHSGPRVPAGSRSSLRPLSIEGETTRQSSGEMRREDAKACLQMKMRMMMRRPYPNTVIASAAKQSKLLPRRRSGLLRRISAKLIRNFVASSSQ